MFGACIQGGVGTPPRAPDVNDGHTHHTWETVCSIADGTTETTRPTPIPVPNGHRASVVPTGTDTTT
eukprot:m.1597238 g.1597238  ORF g.1597238 m.1597238 type:complete len:67 (-) comp25344_c0_seq2:616-816(-)